MKKQNDEVVFETMNEMIYYFEEQKQTDLWSKTPVNEMRVIPVPEAPICASCLTYPDPIDQACISLATERDIIKAMEGTKLMLSYHDEGIQHTVPIHGCAFDTLLSRASIAGTAMKRHTPENQALILNMCLDLWTKRGLILKREEEIFAVHSAEEYEILPQVDLLKMLDEYLNTTMGGYKLHAAVSCDTRTVCRFSLTDSTILDKLKNSLKRVRNKTLNDAVPILVFSTSDTRMSGANLYPYVQIGDCYMRIGSTLLLRHGHNNTIGDFQENLQNIYKSFQDSADSMTRLAKTKIYYPENCFRRLADRARLATGAVDKYIENEFIPGIAYTAYDLYFMLWHVIGYLKEKSLESQMMTEESIARLQTMDFSKFDRPESVA